MKQNNIDRIIKETCTEFNSELDIHSDIKIPEFNTIMNKFHGNLKEKSNRSSITKKLALVAGFTLVIIISTFISSIPKVTAFKFNIMKKFEELRGNTRDIKFSTNDDGLNKNSNSSVLKSNDSADQIEKLVTIDEAKKEVPFKLLVPTYIPDGYKLKTVKLVKAMSSNLRTENLIIDNLKINFATDDKNFKTMLWFDNNTKNEVLMPYDFTDIQMKRIIGLLK